MARMGKGEEGRGEREEGRSAGHRDNGTRTGDRRWKVGERRAVFRLRSSLFAIPSPSLQMTPLPELIIEPGRAERNYWRDLWRYRELFYFLAWRDILLRYKQTVIGIAWALVRPFLTMVVFTFVFSKIAKLPAPGAVPYALMVFAAMLPWQFFATALSESSNSLIGNANLISKIYFPRLIVPAGSVITSFVDFLITLTLMAALMVWYRFLPDWRIVTLPIFLASSFVA